MLLKDRSDAQIDVKGCKIEDRYFVTGVYPPEKVWSDAKLD